MNCTGRGEDAGRGGVRVNGRSERMDGSSVITEGSYRTGLPLLKRVDRDSCTPLAFVVFLGVDLVVLFCFAS